MRVLTLVLALCCPLFAEGYVLGTATGSVYSEMLQELVPQEISLCYLSDPGDLHGLFLQMADASCTAFFLLPDSVPEEIISMLRKFQEWNEKATMMRVSIKKDIGDVAAVALCKTWTDAVFKRLTEMNFKFVSEDSASHMLLLTVPDMASIKGDECSLDVLLFTASEAASLLELLEQHDELIAGVRRQEEIAKEFQ